MRGSTLKAAVAGGVAGALVAAATAAVAGTGVGGVFNLGKTNSVNGATSLLGSSSGTQLVVHNSGAGAGVISQAANGGYPAVMGANSASSGQGRGVVGTSASSQGAGVEGDASASGVGATDVGVKGVSAGGSGSGVEGIAGNGAGVTGTSSNDDGVYGFSQGGGRGVYGFATGTSASGRAGVYGQGGGANAGGIFTSGSGIAGKFSSFSGPGVVAIGPGDTGHQDTGGNGVDAGTTASGQAAVWAHFDSTAHHGVGISAYAPTGSKAGLFQGDVNVQGDLNVSGNLTGVTQRVDFNENLGQPDKSVALGESVTATLQCYNDGGGDPTVRVLMTNNGSQTASLNTSFIGNESNGGGNAFDDQSPVAGGAQGALFVGSTNTLGGLEEPRGTGQFVWRKAGETVTGTFDYYVNASHCEVYANTVRTN
jgi:hypothetical protein